MDRRNFLRIIPLAAVAPKVVSDGVVSLNLPVGHYVVVCDARIVSIENLAETPGILPEGSTGGCIIGVWGDPEDAIKFYKLDEKA